MVSVAGVAPILVHVARTGETFQVSGVGPYPRASSVAYFRERHGGQIPPGLPRTVVPAAPDAWLTALERWGTMSFGDVARAATEHAERGFPVSTFSAYQMATNADKYRRWPTSVALFLRDDRAYRAGEILVQRELGDTLRRMGRARPQRTRVPPPDRRDREARVRGPRRVLRRPALRGDSRDRPPLEGVRRGAPRARGRPGVARDAAGRGSASADRRATSRGGAAPRGRLAPGAVRPGD